MATRSVLTFFVNGKQYDLDGSSIDPGMPLGRFLREEGYLSVKKGCGRGVCGSCTVTLSRWNADAKKPVHKAINSCLTPLATVDFASVTTNEGLGTHQKMHPIQDRFHKVHASQCGFCTPGMVMNLYSQLKANPGATAAQLEANMDGNYCRCTGYRSIVQAFDSFASDATPKSVTEEQDGSVSECCQGLPADAIGAVQLEDEEGRVFPAFLEQNQASTLHVVGQSSQYFRPSTLKEAQDFLAGNDKAIVISGSQSRPYERGSFTGVDVRFIPELNVATLKDGSEAILGAGLSLAAVAQTLSAATPNSAAAALRSIILRSANMQVRNQATLGGHLALAECNSDLISVLQVANASVRVLKADGTEATYNAATEWVLGDAGRGRYTTPLARGDVILSVQMPRDAFGTVVLAYKTAPRDQASRCWVSGAASVVVTDGTVTQAAAFALVGVAPVPVVATAVGAALTGKALGPDVVPAVFAALGDDIGATVAKLEEGDYRRSLAEGYAFKFVHSAAALSSGQEDAFAATQRPALQAVQRFKAEGQMANAPVPHLSADLQCTGEARYTDDAQFQGVLEGALIVSTRAHAKIVRIDDEPARALQGVVDIIYASDLAANVCGAFGDLPIFATDEVHHHGQPIGMILAEDWETAVRASFAVQIEYKDLPAITSLAQAAAAEDTAEWEFLPFLHSSKQQGDVEAGFAEADKVLEGTVDIPGAEHWYLEPHSVWVTPGERNELDVCGTVQDVSGLAHDIARAVQVPVSRINVQLKRLGGGFGGKGAATGWMVAAVAGAMRHRRPVKCTLPRSTDNLVTPKRAPFRGTYKVGVKNDGTLTAIQWRVCSAGGPYNLFSPAIVSEVISMITGPYYCPNVDLAGKSFKTNTWPTCAMRGAGGPQAAALCEQMMHHVAHALGMDTAEFRRKNFLTAGVTDFGVELKSETVHRCTEQVMQGYAERVAAVEAFNAANRWKKRGVAMTPIKYGIFPAIFKMLNQGKVLLHMYGDGSVILHHGGVEMGQGVHTKLAQLVADELDMPLSMVTVGDNSSSKMGQTMGTGGSVTMDRHGFAAIDACQKLKESIATIRQYAPAMGVPSDAPLAMVAGLSTLFRIPLTVYGYSAPDVDPIVEEKHGFGYWSWAASVSEVEVDVLSGDYRVLRVDTVQDVGNSVNPAIDVGQTEGGFIQGMGWLTTEDLRCTESGTLATAQAEDYHIPTAANIPEVFNMSLLANAPGPQVKSSKAIGEPPYLLANCVVVALQDAVQAARSAIGLNTYCPLKLPATKAEIRHAMGDQLGKEAKQ